MPSLTYAETHVSGSSPYPVTTWSKEGNPYIIDDSIQFYSNQKLSIGPGVVIMSASTTDGPNTIWSDGETIISGTKEEPVRLIKMWGIVLGKKSVIEHAVFEDTGIDSEFEFGTTTLSSVKVSGADTAVYARASHIDIKDSQFVDNKRGIYSPVTLKNGIIDKNATQNHITVHNSTFSRNRDFSIKNMTPSVIDATNNWWGTPEGPGTTTAGAVITDPWLKELPKEEIEIICCSNVLFIPGLEASRLYREEPGFLGIGTSTNRLWEPNRNDDVRKLFLGPDGASTGTPVYARDIIDSAFGLKGIYGKFIAMMNSVVADKIINDWLPFAYDWRMSPTDIVLGNNLYATTTKRLIEETENLALTSKTGKVTIIAHSNGGLVAKILGNELEKMGKSGLIDKVIFVALPALGTPQAIVGMLHGDDQAIGGGYILKSGVARTFGLNMPGAYGLLPSSQYFNRIITPVMTFAGKAVGSYSAFADFLTGKSDGRLQPNESDLKSPAVLSPGLLSKADWTHSILDSWNFPTTTDVLSIAGWGTPTTQTIEYSSSSPRIRKGPEGDGTVVAESASPTMYFNQGLYNHDLKKDITHAYILEGDPVRDTISKVIATSSWASVNSISFSPYITYTKPNAGDYPWMKWYTVSVHSPVDMDIYDSHGGHMGIVPLPGYPESDIMWLDNTIGGQYDAIGDEKYFTIPADETYTVNIKGTGTGNFTFQVQKFEGGNMTEVSNTVYADLPVTPLLSATTTIDSSTTTPPLNLDFDGNGTVDIKTPPSPTLNPLIHLDAMKTIILSLHLKQSTEKNLLQKIEHVRKFIQKDKNGKAIKKIRSVVEKVEEKHWGLKKLTEDERQTIVSMFDTLLSALEATDD